MSCGVVDGRDVWEILLDWGCFARIGGICLIDLGMFREIQEGRHPLRQVAFALLLEGPTLLLVVKAVSAYRMTWSMEKRASVVEIAEQSPSQSWSSHPSEHQDGAQCKVVKIG